MIKVIIDGKEFEIDENDPEIYALVDLPPITQSRIILGVIRLLLEVPDMESIMAHTGRLVRRIRDKNWDAVSGMIRPYDK